MPSITLLIALVLLLDGGLVDVRGQADFSNAVEVFPLPFTPTQRKFSMSIEEESHLGDVLFRVVPSQESGIASFSRLDISPNCSGADFFIVSNATTGEIRLSRLLDYEFEKTLDLDVRAWLAPPASGSISSSAKDAPIAHALVGIQVININDHEPFFDAPVDPQTGDMHAIVPENSAPGTLVAKLHASDADQGEVGEIRYSIFGVAPGTSKDFAQAFSVDPVDGSVRIANSTLLDRESVRDIDLLVVAIDNPSHPKRQYSAVGRLTVTITDQNDMSPTFNASSFVVPPVCECSKQSYVITQIIANDVDQSSSGKITYRIVGANVTFSPYVPDSLLATDPRSLFAIDQNTGVVTVSAETLASLIGNFSLLIEATDQGGLTGRTKLIFSVSSDNNFSPEYTVPSSGWTDGALLNENALNGTRVFQVTAIDRDTFGTNNQIEFYFYNSASKSVVSQLSSGFRIDKSNGIIYSTRTFDAEIDALTFNLTVVARDRGIPPRQSNATLTVHIMDIDEAPPRWAISAADGCNMQFNFYIPEKSPIGGRVGRVWAEDSDRTNRSYFRMEPRSDTKYFSINPTTGMITIANPNADNNPSTTTPGQQEATFLDFEDKEHRDFVLLISVSSLGGFAGGDTSTTATTNSGQPGQPMTPVGCLRNNVARVYIHVTNMEDYTPSFTRHQKQYYYCVAANAVRNTLVSTMPDLAAVDPDGAKLTFRMSSSEWRSSAGYVTVSCAFRLLQPTSVQGNLLSKALLLVNSPLGNYSRSYFRIPIDVRDQGGLSDSTKAFVWVVPADQSSLPPSTELTVKPPSDPNAIIQPDTSSLSDTYYANVVVTQKYEDFIAHLDEWVDCVSETLLAGDRFFAGAPLCIGAVSRNGNDANGLTDVRIAAATTSDMLLSPAVLFVAALQQRINATGMKCGVIGATCATCGTAVVAPITSNTVIAGAAGGGFSPLALLIALACILLFLILLLLILLAVCCRARRKQPILIAAPAIAIQREERADLALPVFTVKPARLYETQEAFMSVEDQAAAAAAAIITDRGFEEQEICIDEGLEEEEVFEIPLPREYETQTVLLEMPTWAANREMGEEGFTLQLDHGLEEPQEITLSQQNAGRHLSGSVYSEPYFRASHTEQRAYSMLHIDTRPPIRQHSSQAHRRPESTLPPTDLSPMSSRPGSRLVMTLTAPEETFPMTSRTPSVAGRLSRSGVPTPSVTNLPGGMSHIAFRLGDEGRSPSPLPQYQPQQARGSPPRGSSPARPGQRGLLRPAISADSITLLTQPQQARRAALHQKQARDRPSRRHHRNRYPEEYPSEESQPSDDEGTMEERPIDDDAMRNSGNGRLRRTRSLPKYLQPPVELQSVIAELHDYIKSPEQKARRRRISEKYREKLLASGGAAALGNHHQETTSSSSESLSQDPSSLHAPRRPRPQFSSPIRNQHEYF